MSPRSMFVGVFLILVVLVLNATIYVVPVYNKAVVLRFGRIIDLPEPGLNIKVPFIDEVRQFDGRIMTLDAPTKSFQTINNKRLDVDAFVKWQISDIQQYYESTDEGNLDRARDLILKRINGRLGNEVGRRTLYQVVSGGRVDIEVPELFELNAQDFQIVWNKQRGDDLKIGDLIAEIKTDKTIQVTSPIDGKLVEMVSKEELLTLQVKAPIVAAVSPGERDKLMEAVVDEVRDSLREGLGVELIDVRVKRIDLPVDVRGSVIERMVSARELEAQEYRSQGKELAEGTRAEADRQVAVILADAYRQKQVIEGEGDAKAAAIYAEVHNKNPEFYSFVRSLQAYQKAFAEGDEPGMMVIDPKSDFFRYLNSIQPDISQ